MLPPYISDFSDKGLSTFGTLSSRLFAQVPSQFSFPLCRVREFHTDKEATEQGAGRGMKGQHFNTSDPQTQSVSSISTLAIGWGIDQEECQHCPVISHSLKPDPSQLETQQSKDRFLIGLALWPFLTGKNAA